MLIGVHGKMSLPALVPVGFVLARPIDADQVTIGCIYVAWPRLKVKGCGITSMPRFGRRFVQFWVIRTGLVPTGVVPTGVIPTESRIERGTT